MCKQHPDQFGPCNVSVDNADEFRPIIKDVDSMKNNNVKLGN